MIELEPNTYNYGSRATFYEKSDEYYLAIADYTEALELNPKDDFIYEQRAKLYGKINKNKVIQQFTKAIELAPKYNYAYYMRGKAYYETKNYHPAIEDFTKSIEFGRNFAYRDRGLCYLALGEEAKAQADFAKAKHFGYKD